MYKLKVLVILIDLFATSLALRTEQCDGKVCLTLFLADEAASFEAAKSKCKTDANSELAAINEVEISGTVLSFLHPLERELNVAFNFPIFIDLKRKPAVGAKWRTLDGKDYKFISVDSENVARELCGLIYLDKAIFKAKAAPPWTRRNYICEYAENVYLCAANPWQQDAAERNSVRTQGKCIVRKLENVTWWEARSSCHYSGGDLGTLDYTSSDGIYADGLFSVLGGRDNTSYWIGAYRDGSAWVSPSDGDQPLIFHFWSATRNRSGGSCGCMDPHGEPAFSWTDCDCDAKTAFLCMRKDPPKAKSRFTIAPQGEVKMSSGLRVNSGDCVCNDTGYGRSFETDVLESDNPLPVRVFHRCLSPLHIKRQRITNLDHITYHKFKEARTSCSGRFPKLFERNRVRRRSSPKKTSNSKTACKLASREILVERY